MNQKIFGPPGETPCLGGRVPSPSSAEYDDGEHLLPYSYMIYHTAYDATVRGVEFVKSNERQLRCQWRSLDVN